MTTSKKPLPKKSLTPLEFRLAELEAENARLKMALEFFPTGMHWALRKAREIAVGEVRRGLCDSELLLGSIMLMREVVNASVVAQMLGGRKFKPAKLQLIFHAMLDLEREGQWTDAVSVSGLLEARGQLEAVGGLRYLGSIARDTPADCQPFEILGRILRGEP